MEGGGITIPDGGGVLFGILSLAAILLKRKDLFKKRPCAACEVYKAQLDRREADNLTLQKENRDLNESFRDIGIKSRGNQKKHG